jgi:ribosome-binding protein aMBF1 (putative translation factor)
MNLTETIKKAIETSGQSRETIARETRVDRAALSRFVRGGMGISLSTADKLADYFGLELKTKKTKGK